jgi:hypothetical protein
MSVSKQKTLLANPGHQRVSVGMGAIFAVFLCVFAAWRLCVKFLLHGYG